MSELCAGIARCVITPPAGIPLVGFAGRGPAIDVHDDLTATALVLESGGNRAAIIALDLIGITERFTAEVGAGIEVRTGVPADRVLLCASHTHYGPATGAYQAGELPPDVAAYVANLKNLLAGAAQMAADRLAPVTMGIAEGTCPIGVNRRERRADGMIVLGQNPGGPCDPTVGVIRLDTLDGTPLAALISFACHGVSAAHAMRSISADFVGRMRALVEPATGAATLFLQGAAGNINPIEMRHSFEPARRLGTMLAGEVMKLYAGIATTPASGVSGMHVDAELPAYMFASREEAERELVERERVFERAQRDETDEGALWWAESRLVLAQQACAAWRSGARLPPIGARLHGLRFGDAALVTAPAEIFTETGMALRARSPLPATYVVGYTNGTIGYVPTVGAYPEGGYEVTHACRVGPDAVDMIEQGWRGMLHTLCTEHPGSD